MRGLSLFWLPYSTFTLYGLSVFAMFYGLDWIATIPPTVKLASQEFGTERATPRWVVRERAASSGTPSGT